MARRGSPLASRFRSRASESPTRQISTDLPNAEIGVSPKGLILTIMERTGNIWVLDNVDR
jgi:hypothetical protein